MKTYLQSFDFLTPDDIEQLLSCSARRLLKKSDYWIREGQICREVAFVQRGTLRSFYTSGKGNEITYCITFPQNFLTAYSSFITGQATEENIQALTEVELLVVPRHCIQDLEQKNPAWLRFLKIMAEQQYLELEQRVFQLQKNNASKRYADLIKNHPGYIQHIPLQYLASYLNITQRHLSRIRKEMDF